jgi:hypothetical protein
VNINRRAIRAVFANIVYALKSSNFVIGVALCFAVLFAEVIQSAFSGIDFVKEGMGSAYFFNISVHFGYYIYAAPLVCSYASSWLFCDDAEAGFYRLRLLHSGRLGYRSGLWFGTTFCGGLSLFVGVSLFAVACAILFPAHVSAEKIAVLDSWVGVLNGSGSNWLYMALNAILAFLFGAVWSGVGLLVSIFAQNRYVAFFAPFIICFCSVLILPPAFQPLEMLVQMNWHDFTFVKLVMYQAALYIVTMIAFDYSFERRVIREQA